MIQGIWGINVASVLIESAGCWGLRTLGLKSNFYFLSIPVATIKMQAFTISHLSSPLLSVIVSLWVSQPAPIHSVCQISLSKMLFFVMVLETLENRRWTHSLELQGRSDGVMDRTGVVGGSRRPLPSCSPIPSSLLLHKGIKGNLTFIKILACQLSLTPPFFFLLLLFCLVLFLSSLKVCKRTERNPQLMLFNSQLLK